jgi:hypothetical protein
MKWGDNFKVETGVFEVDPDMRLEFRGDMLDCKEPHKIFYLIRNPGMIVGKIKIPLEEFDV